MFYFYVIYITRQFLSYYTPISHIITVDYFIIINHKAVWSKGKTRSFEDTRTLLWG